jgi:UDP-N-acetylbacillosamine N-acetyltransferase
MFMKNEIIIIGAFHEIIELAEELNFKIIGLIDCEKTVEYRGYPILANDNTAAKLPMRMMEIPLIVSPDIPAIRKRLKEIYSSYGFGFQTLISNTCKISKSAIIGSGVVIKEGVNVSAEVKIFNFVKLNTNCNIMHNSVIGSFTTVAPNAVVLGNVIIGESCYIGANSTILPNVIICDNVVIGAGSLVTKNIEIPGTYIGQPARIMKSK